MFLGPACARGGSIPNPRLSLYGHAPSGSLTVAVAEQRESPPTASGATQRPPGPVPVLALPQRVPGAVVPVCQALLLLLLLLLSGSALLSLPLSTV